MFCVFFYFFLYLNILQQLKYQPTNNERMYENYGFYLLTGSSRTTLEKTNGMAWYGKCLCYSRILLFIYNWIHAHSHPHLRLRSVHKSLYSSSSTVRFVCCFFFLFAGCCIFSNIKSNPMYTDSSQYQWNEQIFASNSWQPQFIAKQHTLSEALYCRTCAHTAVAHLFSILFNPIHLWICCVMFAYIRCAYILRGYFCACAFAT